MKTYLLERSASLADFDEEGYLLANPDVARAIEAQALPSGWRHFVDHGHLEERKQLMNPAERARLKRVKLERIRPLLRRDLPHSWREDMVDYLSGELRETAGAIESTPVSTHPYSPDIQDLIARYPDGLILDCGAGRRREYYSNVVNLEIVPYDSTDVLAVGEVLPFRDASFDAVLSIAVLEHVRDPFRCAREIARVLKPGGELFVAVPFLQPLHGYPHHYYNMSHEGLRNLFAGLLQVESQQVAKSGLPIWSLSWMLNSWAQGLSGAAREQFLNLKVSDLLQAAPNYYDQPFVTGLSAEKNFELASVTELRARKR